MKTDHGCAHDAEVEALDELARERHEAGECRGAPYCVWCVDAIERGEESRGG